MSGRMGEEPVELSFAKHETRSAIDVCGRDSRTNCRYGRLLRFENGLI